MKITDTKRIMEEFAKQSLTEHLSDLRKSLISSLAAVGVGFALAYSFAETIGEWFLQPLYDVLPDKSTLIFTSYQEAFFFI